jgi:DNA-binding beta-propeller fold protein YncE
MRRAALLLILALLAALTAAPAEAAKKKRKAKPKTRIVLFVGNNWDGTADVVAPRKFRRLARLNIIPDIQERMAEIQADPERQAYFLGIRELVGEGHDQFVDDMFASPNGRFLYVSRPSLADVVAIDLKTRKIVWRTKVDGNRADHMAISPNGKRVLVSASTERVVDVIDTSDGRIVGRIPSGDQPHENNFSKDGKLIFHASIGSVFTPSDDPLLDSTKGDRWFQVVDARTLEVLKRIDMGEKLDEFGEPDMSSAVRPMALSPDERFLYFQVSFFHGFVEYDLQQDRVLRLARLPVSDDAARKRREEYLLDSAHHGLAMNPAGTKLCAAGTMSDYAAIVSRKTFSYTIPAHGIKPYWSTNSAGGRYCFVSFSGDDAVSVISYRKERELARIPVGDHPQRMRNGRVQAGLVGTKKPAKRKRARRRR